VVAVGEAPEPLRGFRRGGVPHDPAHDNALGENVVIFWAPYARRGARRSQADAPEQVVIEQPSLEVPAPA
jgi:hypothetical protein